MAGQPDDSNVTPGDGPGAGYVKLPGIIALAAYLLFLNLFILWQLQALWPSCEIDVQAQPSATSTPTTPPSDTHRTGKPDAVTGGSAGQSSALKVDRLDPTSGSTTGGESVTVGGTGFKAGATVHFANAPALKVAVASPSKITAITPAHAAAEKVDVKVTNQDGSSDTLRGGYSYGAATVQGQTTANPAVTVKVTSISPKSGDIAGGTPVEITGEGFLENPTVTIGESPATEVQTKSTTLIVAKTPAHAAGAADVIVTNQDKSSDKLLAGYVYDACLAKCRSRLLLLVLLAGALGGCFHALRSLWMFVGNCSLKQSWALMYLFLPVNGAALAFIFFIVISAGSGFFTQPKSSNSCFWIIGIAALVGMFSQQAAEKLKKIAESLFTPVPPTTGQLPGGGQPSGGLSVTSIKPPHGSVGTPVEITGTGFTDKTTVTFGSAAGDNIKFVSSSSISVNAPAGNQPGPVDVTVTDPGSTAKAVKPAGYTYD